MSDERSDDLPRALREALGAKAGRLQPATGAWERRRRPSQGRPRWVLPAAAAAAVVAVAVVLSVVASRPADRGSQPPAAVAATSTASNAAASPTVNSPMPSRPPDSNRESEPVVTATSALLTPTPTAPITLVASSPLLRPDCAGTTTGCLQHPHRTFVADGSTSAADDFYDSDVGQGGATISMVDTGAGIITLTNGSITRQVTSTAKGPLLYVGTTPLAGGKTGIWGVVDSEVATVAIRPSTFVVISPPTMYGLGSHAGFVSNPTPLPLNFSGYDAAGHQLFSVQVTG